jgi:hypothetical protein
MPEKREKMVNENSRLVGRQVKSWTGYGSVVPVLN